jgi:hypothetical protein
MVQLGTEELSAIAAWPQDLLHDPRTGNVVGFLMPRIDGHHEIHKLYGPADRKLAFPDAGWGFLIRASRNLAAAFDAVHRHGHVIGDVNQGNVVVSRQATVRLIDCDSFQITHLGRNYPCSVGVPLFTPPELQGRKLDELARTPEHDRFGLAVLVFHLLFMGRHPFAGRHPDRAIPVETALREGLFAFGRKAMGSGIVPPPYSLWLRDLTPAVAELFERAFGREAIEKAASDGRGVGGRSRASGGEPPHLPGRPQARSQPRERLLSLVPDRERRRTVVFLPAAGSRAGLVRPRRCMALDRGDRVARPGRAAGRLFHRPRGGRRSRHRGTPRAAGGARRRRAPHLQPLRRSSAREAGHDASPEQRAAARDAVGGGAAISASSR